MITKKPIIELLAFCTLVLFFFVASSRSTQAAAVSDYKNAPGSLCKTYYTNYGPPWDVPAVSPGTTTQGLSAVMGNTVVGLQWNSPAYFDMPSLTGRVEVTCPIIRDNPNDSAGITRAWIDLTVQAYANNPDPNRKATCNIVESTEIFASGAAFLSENYSGANAVVTQGNGVTRLQLVPPTAPTMTRPPNVVAVNGFQDGAAAIHCTLPPDTAIWSYQWKENGGNSTDW